MKGMYSVVLPINGSPNIQCARELEGVFHLMSCSKLKKCNRKAIYMWTNSQGVLRSEQIHLYYIPQVAVVAIQSDGTVFDEFHVS